MGSSTGGMWRQTPRTGRMIGSPGECLQHYITLFFWVIKYVIPNGRGARGGSRTRTEGELPQDFKPCASASFATRAQRLSRTGRGISQRREGQPQRSGRSVSSTKRLVSEEKTTRPKLALNCGAAGFIA